MPYRQNAFTLIELMVVIMIVAVLAAVAVPVISGYIKKARKAEAVTAMGIIYAAERKYYAEWDSYRSSAGNRAAFFNAIGIAQQDLDGVYFSNLCYTVKEPETDFIRCNPARSTAPKRAEVNREGPITMNENGAVQGY